jgi:DnaJ-domain-containing protein 1
MYIQLQINGIQIKENGDKKGENPELLMEIMEAWEELDEVTNDEDLNQVKKSNDGMLTFESLATTHVDSTHVFLQDRIHSTVSKISNSYKENNLEKAAQYTKELKYWYSLRDHILNMDLSLHQ